MGTYLIIKKKHGLTKELKKWFNDWKPFYNDFGDKHNFDDIFGEKGIYRNVRVKIGVMDKKFYPKKAIKELKVIGFTKEV